MDDELHHHELDPETAELLISHASKRTDRHTAPPASDLNEDGPLNSLLAAASTPDYHRAMAGEQAAVKAFRAAQHPPVSTHRRTIRRAALAALAALSLGGTAITAVQTGLAIALHPRPSTTRTTTPAGQAHGTPPINPSGATSQPGGTPTRPLSTSSGPAPQATPHHGIKPNQAKHHNQSRGKSSQPPQRIPNRFSVQSLRKQKEKLE